MSGFFANLNNGNIDFPAVVMNQGPLPTNVSGAGEQFNSVDGRINEAQSLLGDLEPYEYGRKQGSRLSTQTQFTLHTMIQHVITPFYLPVPSGAMDSGMGVLIEHHIADGDFVFSLRFHPDMVASGVVTPTCNIQPTRQSFFGTLALVNYILYGLQVGRSDDDFNNRWNIFLAALTSGRSDSHYNEIVNGTDTGYFASKEVLWRFIRTYIAPYGIMVGSQEQGGLHQGGYGRIATHNAVDYVGSFLVDGKARKINNLWRGGNISAGDHLGFVLKRCDPHRNPITKMVLSSSSRAYIEQQTPCVKPWYYLEPVVLKPEHFNEPHIYIGRSQGMYSTINTSFGMGKVVWDARASAVGQPIQVAVGPTFRAALGQWIKYQSSDALAAMGPSGPQAPPAGEPVRRYDGARLDADVNMDQSAINYEGILEDAQVPRFTGHGRLGGGDMEPAYTDADATLAEPEEMLAGDTDAPAQPRKKAKKSKLPPTT